MESLVNKSPQFHIGKPSVYQDLISSLSWKLNVLYAELALGPTSTKSYLGRVQEPNRYLEDWLGACEVVPFTLRLTIEVVENGTDDGSSPLLLCDNTVDEVYNRAMITVKLLKLIWIALATIASAPTWRISKVWIIIYQLYWIKEN